MSTTLEVRGIDSNATKNLERKARIRRRIGLTIRYSALLAVSAIFITPFVLAFFGGFKTNREVLGYPPTVVPIAWSDGANWEMLITGQVPEGADHLAQQVAECAELNILLDEKGLTSKSIEARQLARDNDLPNPPNCPGTVRAIASLNVGILNWSRVWQAGGETCASRGFLGPNCFPYWIFNSVFLAVIRVITRVSLAAMAGYAFARMEFPGKNFIFSVMLATMMIPGILTLIPGFVLMTRIGWVGTYWSLITKGLVEAFGIFLMTQFLKSVPRELEEAALIDGASQFQTMWRVVLPLAKPALLTLTILAFQASWNEYLDPLLYLPGAENFTLPVGLRFFQSQFRSDWNYTLIGSMFNAIPILMIFFVFNRYFIEGVSHSGLKG
jgi:multiple sugar transport system permease protein